MSDAGRSDALTKICRADRGGVKVFAGVLATLSLWPAIFTLYPILRASGVRESRFSKLLCGPSDRLRSAARNHPFLSE